MRVRLLPEVERDLEISADFYEAQQRGLGVRFIDSLSSDIDSLEQFAGIHELHLGFHRSLSKRFPFSIYYKLDDRAVEIYAVLDARQDPNAIDTALETLRKTS